MISFDDTPHWCLSGGAKGADLEWAKYAKENGHAVAHFSFAGHKTKATLSEIYVVPGDMLLEADPHCKKANETLKRRWVPYSLHVANLLRRNWYQVCYADSCYGISTLDNIDKYEWFPLRTKIKSMVNGGTAWAIQMFIDKHEGLSCPCYVFDQNNCSWFKWEEGWVRIYEPPKPSGIWAGIGTRELNFTGKLAIRVLMDKTTKFQLGQ